MFGLGTFLKGKALFAVSSLLAIVLTTGTVSAGGSAIGLWPNLLNFNNDDAHVSITGHVTSAVGSAPIANALVVAQKGNDYFSAAADVNGSYKFTGLATGTYGVNALASGYATLLHNNIQVSTDSTVTLNFNLNTAVLSGSIGSLSASVHSSGGAAVSSPIVLLRQDNVVKAAQQGDANGQVSFANLAVGTYQAIAMASGYAESSPQDAVIQADLATNVSFTLTPILPPLGAITGSVVNSATGNAIANAAVSLKVADSTVATIATDVNGDFTFSNLTPGTYGLHVAAAGYSSANANGIEVTANATATSDFALIALPVVIPVVNPPAAVTGSLSGRVVSAADGTSIEGALEVLKQKATINPFDKSEDVIFETSSRADGRFTFSDLAPGIYALRVKAEGYHDAKVGSIAVLAGESTVVNVALKVSDKKPAVDKNKDKDKDDKNKDDNDRKRGSVRGVVFDFNGKPVVGAIVFFTPGSGQMFKEALFVRTDAQGRYVINGLVAGVYLLRARGEGCEGDGAKVHVEDNMSATANVTLASFKKADIDHSKDSKKDDLRKIASPVKSKTVVDTHATITKPVAAPKVQPMQNDSRSFQEHR